ncbi:hypothetical protein BVY03_04660 [bacterium K02(2017)]|nr:hypothetical protein BVY03_04660 [bacterium K02(2017)]
MPLSALKRKARRLSRRARNWSTIVQHTLQGNKVEKKSNLKNSKNPILMIYGFGATRRTLAILENRLKADGFTIFSFNLGGVFGTFNTSSIEETARYIDKKIERVYKKHKFKGKLTILGHSKGGLIGQYYIKFLRGTKRVKAFVTIGTPHNGTPWALLASYTPVTLILKSLKQMSPMHGFIKKLKDKAFPKSIKVFSIYSKDDTVCPFPTAVLDEKSNIKNIELSGVTHAELLIKKTAYNAIKHALLDNMPESWQDVSRKNYQDHLEKAKLKLLK